MKQLTALKKKTRTLVMAIVRPYTGNHQPEYLETAELIYRFMMSGLDTVTSGGIYWKEGDKSTKNTCSNGPGILVALQLYAKEFITIILKPLH